MVIHVSAPVSAAAFVCANKPIDTAPNDAPVHDVWSDECPSEHRLPKWVWWAVPNTQRAGVETVLRASHTLRLP